MSKVAGRNQRLLLDLVKLPGNDICADCQGRNPRWAAWDHGIFICVQCASIHRKMGTHVSKVKSLTMDTWSREQVENMKLIGNIESNAKLNPSPSLHPPPSATDEEGHGLLTETFIRRKYEYRTFAAIPLRPDHSPQFSASGNSTDIEAAIMHPLLPSENLVDLKMSRSPPSPDLSKKNVRFSSTSLPIPEEPFIRPPSSSLLRRRTTPPRGILRPRSVSAIESGYEIQSTPPKIPIEWPEEDEELPSNAGFNNAIVGSIEPQKTGSAWGLLQRPSVKDGSSWTDQHSFTLDHMTNAMTPEAMQNTSLQSKAVLSQGTGSDSPFYRTDKLERESGTSQLSAMSNVGPKLIGSQHATHGCNPSPSYSQSETFHDNPSTPGQYYDFSLLVGNEDGASSQKIHQPSSTDFVVSPQHSSITNGRQTALGIFRTSLTPQSTGSATNFSHMSNVGPGLAPAKSTSPSQELVWAGLEALSGDKRSMKTQVIESSLMPSLGEQVMPQTPLSFEQVYMTPSLPSNPSSSADPFSPFDPPRASAAKPIRKAFVPSSQFGRQEFGNDLSLNSRKNSSLPLHAATVPSNMTLMLPSMAPVEYSKSLLFKANDNNVPAENGLFDLNRSSMTSQKSYEAAALFRLQAPSFPAQMSTNTSAVNSRPNTNPFIVQDGSTMSIGSIRAALGTVEDSSAISQSSAQQGQHNTYTGNLFQNPIDGATYGDQPNTYMTQQQFQLQQQQPQSRQDDRLIHISNENPFLRSSQSISIGAVSSRMYPLQQSQRTQQEQIRLHNYWH